MFASERRTRKHPHAGGPRGDTAILWYQIKPAARRAGSARSVGYVSPHQCDSNGTRRRPDEGGSGTSETRRHSDDHECLHGSNGAGQAARSPHGADECYKKSRSLRKRLIRPGGGDT